nr:unnamed protein product [Callosobruchus chinensis]
MLSYYIHVDRTRINFPRQLLQSLSALTSAHKLFSPSSSYSYVRCFQIANNKRPMTFCHRMDRALLLRHCVDQVEVCCSR